MLCCFSFSPLHLACINYYYIGIKILVKLTLSNISSAFLSNEFNSLKFDTTALILFCEWCVRCLLNFMHALNVCTNTLAFFFPYCFFSSIMKMWQWFSDSWFHLEVIWKGHVPLLWRKDWSGSIDKKNTAVIKMKFMKLGTRPDTFFTEEATRY